MDELNAQIIFASMLIQLGVATVEQIKGLFTKGGHDDDTLARIMADVNQRIARRA